MNTNRTINSFLSQEYLEFAKYTVENRAIPSICDGLKPGQRKIIFVSNNIWKNGNEKQMKVSQLAGRVAADSKFHHGQNSLSGAIVNIAQKFKNSLPLLDGYGQFGSLRSPFAGADRYISVSLSKYFRMLYKDFYLLEKQYDEGDEIEPKYFLPIIPTILLNGGEGIAVGFSTNILNRSPYELIEQCENILNNKECNNIKPYINEFNGTFNNIDSDKSWIAQGKFEIVNSYTVKITEIPPSSTYEKYELHLISLLDKKIIISYDDNCSDKIEYTLKFKKEDLDNYIKGNKLISLLKLEERQTENIVCLDENKNILEFNSSKEVIEYFVKWRLNFYTKRKDYLISKLNEQINLLENKIRFIEMIIDNSIIINKSTKKYIIEQLESYNFNKIDNDYSYLLNMHIHNLSEESISNFNKQLELNILERDIIIKKSEKQLYLEDLKELKTNLK